MKFIKENSYDIVRLFVNQIGIMIFSWVLYFAVEMAVKSQKSVFSIQTAISVFATVFFMALVYVAGWDFGAKDKIRIDAGRQSYIRLKGVYLSLCANALNFLCGVICVIALGIFLASDAAWGYTVFGYANIPLRILESNFLGICNAIFASLKSDPVNYGYYFWQSVGFLIFPLLPVAATQFGYSMGVRNRRVADLFSGKTSKRS